LEDVLLDRALKAPSVQNSDLDKTTLGKPGHLAISHTSRMTGSGAVALRGLAGVGAGFGAAPVRSFAANSIAPHQSAQPKPSVRRIEGFADSMQPKPSHRTGVVARFQGAKDQTDDIVANGEEYVVEQQKPIGVTWKKGADGGIYASEVDLSADPRIQVGDKLIAVSEPFGRGIWQAGSYKQTMMAIDTRAGDVYLKILSRGGDTDVLTQKNDDANFGAERSAGNYGAATEAEMIKRYRNSKNVEKERLQLFDSAMQEFKAGNYEKALTEYSTARALEPKNFMADDFSRVTELYKVASFNIACCYSNLNQADNGLEALKDAMSAGFDNYNMIRTDPNLEVVRKSPRFKVLMDHFDEPIFNAEVFNWFKR
jgi:hypothetical protein